LQVGRQQIADLEQALRGARMVAGGDAQLGVALEVVDGEFVVLHGQVGLGGQTMALRQADGQFDRTLVEADRVTHPPIRHALGAERQQVRLRHRRDDARVEHLAQEFADDERRQPGRRHDRRDVAATVEQREDRATVGAELVVDRVRGRDEDLARRRNAFADVGPLVDSPRGLHDDAVAVGEEALVDRGVAARDVGRVLVELELRVAAEEEVVEFLLEFGAVLVLEFEGVDVATGEQAVGQGLAHADGVVADLVDRFLREAGIAHERRDHPVEHRMHVVVHRDTPVIEVEHLPEPGRLDAQEADLPIEGQHLEHLGQVYTCKIPT
jgi:hypothetical protein